MEEEKLFKFRKCVYCGKEPKKPPLQSGLCMCCGKRGFKTVYAKGELPQEDNILNRRFIF